MLFRMYYIPLSQDTGIPYAAFLNRFINRFTQVWQGFLHPPAHPTLSQPRLHHPAFVGQENYTLHMHIYSSTFILSR